MKISMKQSVGEMSKVFGTTFSGYPLWWVFLILASLVLPICVFEFMGLGDYGRHLATSFILKQLLLGDSFYQSYFQISPVIQPYILAQSLLILLSFPAGIEAAGRVLLILFVILLPICTYLYEKKVRSSLPVWWPLGFCLVYTWHFNMGFLPYLVGLPLTLLSIRYLYSHAPMVSLKESILSGILLFICYLSHLFAFGVAALVAFFVNLPHIRKRPRYLCLYLLSMIPSSVLLVLYSLRMVNRGPGLRSIVFSSVMDSLKNFFIYTFYSYSKVVGCLMGLIILCIFFSFILFNRSELLRTFKTHNSLNKRNLLIAWLVLMFLFFVIPFQIGPLFFTNARLAPFILLLGIPFLGVPKRGWVLAVVTVIVFVQVFETLRVYSVIDDRYRAVGKTISLMDRESEFMPIVADNNIDDYHMEPYSYFWVYYLIRTHSVGPCLPAGTPDREVGNSPLIYKKLYDRSPGLWPLDKTLAASIIENESYDFVLLWKNPKDDETRILAPLRQKYKVLFDSDTLVIGRKTPSKES